MEIVFENVTYKENTRTPLERTYLKDVSFSLNENKVYAFLGDSKSGKEKLASLINATSLPSKGYIQIGDYFNDGRHIKKVNNLRMNIGYVKMNPLDFEINKLVKDELAFGLKYFKYKLKKEEIRSKEALKLVGLPEEILNRRVYNLTIRERKLLSIASSLIFNPNIIILEEVTAFLLEKDKENIKRLIRIMKEKYGKMVILVTKDTDFAYEVSDEIYLVSDGKVEKCEKEVLLDASILNRYNLNTPRIVDFITEANKKEANLTYTPNILDLIKEVYRNV